MSSFALLWSLVASTIHASQPSAPDPVAAPLRPLVWGDINFLQTTDSHGWHAGHLQEAQYSADWGDYVSFAQRLREQADDRGVDLLVVDTGDRVEGNGLYDASTPKGQYTYDIFREQHIDIITPGNHELYQLDAADREYNQTVPNYGDNYLASNLDYILPGTDVQVPMARRYRKFVTKNRGVHITAFGFLFNFMGNAKNSVVIPVEEAVRQPWFLKAIRDKDVDLFVVAGHVTLPGPEYQAVLTAVRRERPDIPIQFFGGHSHIRDFLQYDDKAFAMQSGRYMETIGWLSISGIDGDQRQKKQVTEQTSFAAKSKYTVNRRYIDNNLYSYHHHTNLTSDTFPTPHGQNVSLSIFGARKALKLDHTYGCVPRNLWLNRAPYPSSDSLLSWLEGTLPAIVTKKARHLEPRIALVNTGTLRFDVFKGAFTRDTTFIISPFKSRFLYIRDVPYENAKRIGDLVNGKSPFMEQADLDIMGVKTEQSTTPYDAGQAGPAGSQRAMQQKQRLTPGYTTVDDFGTDGDDTIHSPIQFYHTPNVLETHIAMPEDHVPDTVDLVFIDFIQPWVLLALRLVGEQYTAADVEVYTEHTLTEALVGWIEEHWSGDC